MISPLVVRRTLLAKYNVVNSSKAIYDHPNLGIFFGDATSLHDLEVLCTRSVYSKLTNYRREDGERVSSGELMGDNDGAAAKADNVEVFTV